MIQFRQVHFSVGRFALTDVSLHVKPGEYFVLLGPTGSGKTMLVECLCGLCRIDSGEILIDGTDVTHQEPRRRGIGYLPQDYALFSHKTVRDNIGFGLNHSWKRGSKNSKKGTGTICAKHPSGRAGKLYLSPFSIRQRVDQLMKQLGLTHLADRLPAKLSGGEKQRVALARALAIRPRVLVLDEPVSALDEQTRDGLCRQLKELQQSTQVTAVHICHNFAEMLAVADRVAIIRQGRILQVGTPQQLLQRPATAEVARFVQAGNLFSARAQILEKGPTDQPRQGRWTRLACADNIEFLASPSDAANPGTDPPLPPLPKGDVLVMVRPENIELTSASSFSNSAPSSSNTAPPPGTTLLQGRIRHVVDCGPVVQVTVACGAQTELLVSLGKKEFHKQRVGVGDEVHLSVSPEDVHVMQQ